MTKIEGKPPHAAMSSHRGGGKNNKRKLRSPQNNTPPPFIHDAGGSNAADESENNNSRVTMEAILHRYHSLTQTHYAETKRRHLESNQRTLENTQRIQQLTSLQKMASETHTLATNLLRSEQHLYRENQRERLDIEKELKKAEQEKALFEDFSCKIGCLDDNFSVGEVLLHVDNERGTIGGVPKKFLDLSHFPKFRNGEEGDMYKSEEDIIGFTQQEDEKRSRHIIDCTEDNPSSAAQKYMHLDDSRPTRIPFTSTIPQGFCQPMDTTDALSSSKTQKKNTKRIYISGASLSHVNGTYLQEVGSYNNAPVFVLAGPPRKFMGFDCSIVLRRERVSPSEYLSLSRNVLLKPTTIGSGGGDPHFIWKIGLAPAHRVTHPRMIGYYFAHEDGRDCAVMSCLDLMGEVSSYFEPPVDGWRVFDESGQGRTSGLKVNYEE